MTGPSFCKACTVRHARALIWAVILAAPPALAADDNIEAGLTVERSHLKTRSGTELRTSRLKIFLVEQLQPGLALSLHGGPVLLTPARNPDTAGMELSGFHVGVGAQAEWFRQQPFGLSAAFDYTYQQTDDKQADRQAKISLHTAQAELAALARLPPARLQLGIYALHLDGDETISGPVHHSRSLKAKRSLGGFLQTDLQVDWSGRISLRLEGGAQQAVGLTFARYF